MNEVDKSRVSRAISIIDRMLYELQNARESFKSARRWGIADIWGGGLFTNLIKHSRISDAAGAMSNINYELGQLREVLEGIALPPEGDYNVRPGGFATFADFYFNGFFSDMYMQSKIVNSLDAVDELGVKLQDLREKLVRIS